MFLWPLQSIFSCWDNFRHWWSRAWTFQQYMEHLLFQNSLWSIKLLTQLTNKLIYSVYSVLFAICPPSLNILREQDGMDSVECSCRKDKILLLRHAGVTINCVRSWKCPSTASPGPCNYSLVLPTKPFADEIVLWVSRLKGDLYLRCDFSSTFA